MTTTQDQDLEITLKMLLQLSSEQQHACQPCMASRQYNTTDTIHSSNNTQKSTDTTTTTTTTTIEEWKNKIQRVQLLYQSQASLWIALKLYYTHLLCDVAPSSPPALKKNIECMQRRDKLLFQHLESQSLLYRNNDASSEKEFHDTHPPPPPPSSQQEIKSIQFPWSEGALYFTQQHRESAPSLLFALLMNHVCDDLDRLLDFLIQYQQESFSNYDIFTSEIIECAEKLSRPLGSTYYLGHLFNTVYSNEVFGSMEAQLREDDASSKHYDQLFTCVSHATNNNNNNNNNNNTDSNTDILPCLKQYEASQSKYIETALDHTRLKQTLLDTAQRIQIEFQTLQSLLNRISPTLVEQYNLTPQRLLEQHHTLESALFYLFTLNQQQ